MADINLDIYRFVDGKYIALLEISGAIPDKEFPYSATTHT